MYVCLMKPPTISFFLLLSITLIGGSFLSAVQSVMHHGNVMCSSGFSKHFHTNMWLSIKTSKIQHEALIHIKPHCPVAFWTTCLWLIGKAILVPTLMQSSSLQKKKYEINIRQYLIHELTVGDSCPAEACSWRPVLLAPSHVIGCLWRSAQSPLSEDRSPPPPAAATQAGCNQLRIHSVCCVYRRAADGISEEACCNPAAVFPSSPHSPAGAVWIRTVKRWPVGAGS